MPIALAAVENTFGREPPVEEPVVDVCACAPNGTRAATNATAAAPKHARETTRRTDDPLKPPSLQIWCWTHSTPGARQPPGLPCGDDLSSRPVEHRSCRCSCPFRHHPA